MPKVKQIRTKQTRCRLATSPPPKRAVKGVTRAPIKPSPTFKRLPTIPPKIGRIISLAKKFKKPNKKSPSPAKKPPSRAKKVKIDQTETKELAKPEIKPISFCIPTKTFQRLCREISLTQVPDCRFTVNALESLQMALEDFMVGFFEDAALCMRYSNRKTLCVKDIELVSKLRKFDYEPI